jgi:hypothetical protein
MPIKTFQNGFPLPASDLNNFLMNQSVMTFASASARASDITSPVEGMLTYLEDSKTYQSWDGSAWVDVIDPDTVINPMTNAGDLIVGGTAGAAERLGIGADAEVLTVIGGAPVWAAGGGGGALDWQLLNPGGTAIALTGAATITLSGIGGYDNYLAIVQGASSNSFSYLGMRVNSIDSGYRRAGLNLSQQASFATNLISGDSGVGDVIPLNLNGNNDTVVTHGYVRISGASQEGFKAFESVGGSPFVSGTTVRSCSVGGILENTETLSSLSLRVSGGDFDGGTMYIYGA